MQIWIYEYYTNMKTYFVATSIVQARASSYRILVQAVWFVFAVVKVAICYSYLFGKWLQSKWDCLLTRKSLLGVLIYSFWIEFVKIRLHFNNKIQFTDQIRPNSSSLNFLPTKMLTVSSNLIGFYCLLTFRECSTGYNIDEWFWETRLIFLFLICWRRYACTDFLFVIRAFRVVKILPPPQLLFYLKF